MDYGRTDSVLSPVFAFVYLFFRRIRADQKINVNENVLWVWITCLVHLLSVLSPLRIGCINVSFITTNLRASAEFFGRSPTQKTALRTHCSPIVFAFFHSNTWQIGPQKHLSISVYIAHSTRPTHTACRYNTTHIRCISSCSHVRLTCLCAVGH